MRVVHNAQFLLICASMNKWQKRTNLKQKSIAYVFSCTIVIMKIHKTIFVLHACHINALLASIQATKVPRVQ